MAALYLCVNNPKREWLLQRGTRGRLFTFDAGQKKKQPQKCLFSVCFRLHCNKTQYKQLTSMCENIVSYKYCFVISICQKSERKVGYIIRV